MKYVSSTNAGWILCGLTCASLSLGGCLKDLGLGSSGPGMSGGSESTGTGGSVGVSTGSESTGTGGAGMGSGTFGVGGGMVGGTSGVGGGMVGGTSGVGGGMVGGTSGVGGGMVGGTTGVGGGGMSTGSHMSTGVGGSVGVSTGSSMSTGVGGSVGVSTGSSMSTGVGGGAAVGCNLGSEPVSCNFSHLNADCASYGAVCDFIFSQCSCCFLHDELTCSTDADCQSSFGAGSFCSAGTCGCK
jgi:hypothetical protein